MMIALDVKIYKNFNFNNLDRFYNFYIDSYDNLDMKDFFDYVADINEAEDGIYPKIHAIKEERKIKVNVFYGGEKLVDCMGRVIKKHTK